MKSIKKRFRMQLAEVMEMARELSCLSEGIDLLLPADELACEILQACQALEQKADGLHKSEFAEQIAGDEALLQLDEAVDCDLISCLEERFAKALEQASMPQLDGLLQQILEKLEKKQVIMNQRIQQLGSLLNESESD